MCSVKQLIYPGSKKKLNENVFYRQINTKKSGIICINLKREQAVLSVLMHAMTLQSFYMTLEFGFIK